MSPPKPRGSCKLAAPYIPADLHIKGELLGREGIELSNYKRTKIVILLEINVLCNFRTKSSTNWPFCGVMIEPAFVVSR